MIKLIKELKFGQRTEKFKRNARPDLAHLSFSLVYRDESTLTGDMRAEEDLTLDLVCKDENEFQHWTSYEH